MLDSGSEASSRDALAREEGPVRRLLTRYFRRRSNSDDVDDLVQDVFTKVVARDSGERIDNLAGYLLRTASSVLADHARRRQSRRAELHVAFDSDRHGEHDVDPERTLAARQELDAAMAALLSLPERTRKVFLLVRLEGYKQREVAAHLGVSLSTVEKDMIRAIRHLSEEVEQRSGS